MSDRSGIEWTDSTWNPTTGCNEVSPGCDHCYAKTLAERFRGTPGHYFEHGFEVQLRPEKLNLPIKWTKPRRIFVNSMSDLFHPAIPDHYIVEVFAVMRAAQRHTFQVLTKRHARMRSLLSSEDFQGDVEHWALGQHGDHRDTPWPLPNVWLGVSAENQQWADIRIPALLDTPAAVRWVSAEPLLGPIDLGRSLAKWSPALNHPKWDNADRMLAREVLHWVVVGGESGRGARPMHPDWARGLRDQCQQARIPFLFKQRGEWSWNEPEQFRMPSEPFTDRVAVMHRAGMTAMTKSNPFNPFERGHPNWATRIERVGKKAAGRELDGRTWDEYPQATARESA